MMITYDKKVDAAYIKLNDKSACHVSKKVTDDVLVDYAKDGSVVGIEVLDASRNMPHPVSQHQIPIEGI
jgi:uncharacterized protein YuzE